MTNKQKEYKQIIDELIEKGKGMIHESSLEDGLSTYLIDIPVLNGRDHIGVGMDLYNNGKVKGYCLYGLRADGEHRCGYQELSTKQWKRFEHELLTIKYDVEFEEKYPEKARENAEKIEEMFSF